ncbi:reverse transcriptase, partial [Paraphaeosphaeria sporulosa]
METGESDARATRRSARTRKKTVKAAELRLENALHEIDSSESSCADEDNHVNLEPPRAPQPNRTRRVPEGLVRGKAANENAEHTRARNKVEGQNLERTLAAILGALEDLRADNSALKAYNQELKTAVEDITRELADTKAQLADARAQLLELSGELRTQTAANGSPSYADVARTPPSSQPSNLRTLSGTTTPTTITDTPYCTIDTSRVEETDRQEAQIGRIREAIERELRTIEGKEKWRCAAVIRDPRDTNRIRISCRSEEELREVKEAAQKTAVRGARILRDQLYPVRIDNANRTAVLNERDEVRQEAAQALGEENEVQIAKMNWLSRKDSGKAYGSMVIYVKRSSEAARLLQGQYFHINGESAYTREFKPH